MRAISLFSGAGGMDLGFERAGIRTVAACEIDRDAAATLRAAFPGTQVFQGCVRDFVTTLSRGDAEMVYGGPPCQGWSVAGKMDPDDERSQHVWSFLSAVERAGPRIFVMENVDSLATLSKWRGAFSDITAKAEAMGYGVAVLVLNGHDMGVPQLRRRMFMVGVRGADSDRLRRAAWAALEGVIQPGQGGTVRAVLERLGPAGTVGNPHTCTARITYALRPVMRSSPYAGMLFNGAGRPLRLDGPAPTVAASAGGNKTHFVDVEELAGAPSFVEEYHAGLRAGGPAREGLAPARLRRLTVRECMALQTFPDSHPFQGRKSAVYRQIGNAVPVELARRVALVALEAAEAVREPESLPLAA